MRRHSISFFLVLALAIPAGAQSTKDRLIRLQTQVETLQQQMTAMQRSFDERMGVMRSLVEQSTDNVNKMAGTLGRLEKTLTTQSAESGDKVDQVSQQVQSLQDAVDELKTRVARLSQQLEDLEAARANIGAAAPVPDAAAAPPADVLYKNALADYTAGRYELAMQQFNDYLKFYRTGELAGNAQFYLADIYFRQQNYQEAIRGYDIVLEQYPGGNKAAAAHLKKAYALLELGRRDDGVRELRALITRYPKTVEATRARERLRKLGPAA